MTTNGVPGQNGRLLHLDMMRLLAIFLVIFNHTGDRGYMLFARSTDSVLYYPYMASSVFCKIAVPLFFMISGALLLPKVESLRHLFVRRILRMFVVLLLISVPYYIWLQRENGLSIKEFFSFIYGKSASTSLWYLYSHIALLLCLPFLRCMVKNMRQKDYLYLFAGHIVLTGVLPCLEACLWNGENTVHASFTPVLFMSQNIFYALMGYFLEHVFERKKERVHFIWGVALSIAAILVTCLMTDWKAVSVGVDSGNTELERFFNCFISVPAMTVYGLAKYVGVRVRGRRLDRWISVLGASVFGVYLIEKAARALTDAVYTFLHPLQDRLRHRCSGALHHCVSRF